jgi:putative FmdB family regulatory protein
VTDFPPLVRRDGSQRKSGHTLLAMPTYTYRCQKCGHEFERFQSMSDEPVKRCEKCRSKVQRVFHPVGIVLKGPGFYKTDHRSASKKSSGDSRSSERSSEKSRDTKSESTPDSKSSDSSSSEKGSQKKSDKTSGSTSSSDA